MSPDIAWIIKKKILTRRSHDYELALKHRLKQFTGYQFWDIGANIGLYSILLRKNFEWVHAFEPNPSTFNELKHRTLGMNIEIHEIAFSNLDGMVPFATQPMNWGGLRNSFNANASDSLLLKFEFKSSSNPRLDHVYENRPNIMVHACQADTLRTSKPVDLAKIDVEGAEFLVLEGMRESLKDHYMRNVVVELHNRDRKEELEHIFIEQGYHLEWVDPDHLLAISIL